MAVSVTMVPLLLVCASPCAECSNHLVLAVLHCQMMANWKLYSWCP